MEYPKGNPFTALRREKGLTQKQLAEEFKKKGFIGISDKEISRLENGINRYPDTYKIKAYSQYFKVAEEYLLGVTSNRSPNENIKMICQTTGLTEDSVKTLKALKISGKKYEQYSIIQLTDVLNHILSDTLLCKMFLNCIGDMLDGQLDTQLHYDKKEECFIPENFHPSDIDVISSPENHFIVGSTKEPEQRAFIPINDILTTYNKELLSNIIDKYIESYKIKKGEINAKDEKYTKSK